MIKSIKEKPEFPLQIDLTSRDGHLMNLLRVVANLSCILNDRRGGEYFDSVAIQKDMTSKDYEHAVEVMEKHFGDYVIMYR